MLECPKCGSEKTRYKGKGNNLFQGIFFCEECEYVWLNRWEKKPQKEDILGKV